jgi:hypothetical protein
LANRQTDETKHNGKDLRPPRLSERNAKPARLLAGSTAGIEGHTLDKILNRS